MVKHSFTLFPMHADGERSLARVQAPSPSPVGIPEPATLALLGTGLFFLAFRLRPRHKKEH